MTGWNYVKKQLLEKFGFGNEMKKMVKPVLPGRIDVSFQNKSISIFLDFSKSFKITLKSLLSQYIYNIFSS